MHLDKQHPRPVYLQLKELLQNQIEQGVYLAHQKLPSERDLCQHHNLSRMTARRALKELIADGFAYTRVGKGTFVSDSSNVSGKVVTDSWYPNRSLEFGYSALNARFKQELVRSLSAFDYLGVEQVINEILAIHSLEAVTGNLFLDIIRYSEQQWRDGTVSLVTHNYVNTTLRSHLIAMMTAAAATQSGPKVLLACAPEDQHEIGLILIALSLRRRGFGVIYLGPNLVAKDLDYVVNLVRPALICISAATDRAVNNLTNLSKQFSYTHQNGRSHQNSSYYRPLFSFGGVAFTRNPKAVSDIAGQYLGNTVEEAVDKIHELIAV